MGRNELYQTQRIFWRPVSEKPFEQVGGIADKNGVEGIEYLITTKHGKKVTVGVYILGHWYTFDYYRNEYIEVEITGWANMPARYEVSN